MRPVAVAAGYEEGSAMTEKRAGLSAMTDGAAELLKKHTQL